jgi:hypothetical protein
MISMLVVYSAWYGGMRSPVEDIQRSLAHAHCMVPECRRVLAAVILLASPSPAAEADYTVPLDGVLRTGP